MGPEGRKGMKIEARDLSFTYPGREKPTLRNINLTIEPGEVVAIVGFNGGGKSTLMNVLLRLYDFQSGSLYINDQDCRKYDPSDIQRHCTALFQTAAKYTNQSVKENTGVGKVELIDSDPAITAALENGGARPFVDPLPRGLDTKLEFGGYGSYSNPSIPSDLPGYGRGYAPSQQDRVTLSGGQWQRIAISRAFMRADTSDLWLVDEGSASLDPQAQTEFFERLVRSRADRSKTIIFITHTMSTVRWADKIAVVDNGTIAEFGSHKDLMLRNGAYAQLHRAMPEAH